MSREAPGKTTSAQAFLQGAERRATVADWLARKVRILGRSATGLPVVALPALAAAQGAGEYVPLGSVDGVASVTPLPDGSYQITLTSGEQLTLSAAEVQVVGGAVQVSAEAAATIAQVSAAAGTTGMGALAAVGAGGLAAAAGGGASGGGGSGGGGSGASGSGASGSGASGSGAGGSGVSGSGASGSGASGSGAGGSGAGGSGASGSGAGGSGASGSGVSGSGASGSGAGGSGAGGSGASGSGAGGSGASGSGVSGSGASGLGGQAATGGTSPGPGAAGPVTLLNREDALGGGVSSNSSGFTAPEGASEVVVSFGDDPREFSATLAETGAWALSLRPEDLDGLPQGTVAVTATARDAGGATLASGTARFDIDTIPPDLPTADLVNDTGVAEDDDVTTDASLDLSAPPADGTREIVVNGESQGATYTPPTLPGDYTVQIIDTDAAGNTATGQVSFELLPVLNLQIVLDSALTAFTPPEGTTDLIVTFGAGEEEPDLEAVLSAGESAFSAVLSAVAGQAQMEFAAVLGDDGAWQLPLTAEERAALPQGQTTITLSARDAAGKELASETRSIVVDTVAPAVPAVALTQDTGVSDDDDLTADASLTISAPPPDAVREVRIDGVLQGPGYTPPTEDGTYTVYGLCCAKSVKPVPPLSPDTLIPLAP